MPYGERTCNPDIVDLWCRHLPSGELVPVPFLDTRAIHVASILIGGQTTPIADIRQYVPDPSDNTNA
ncbi:hypothetical protein LP417_34685 (plasmid) [Polaromonas sp. P1-6]|nr:hypothetical protein LP417_34685 [Polaromonas sp. P1-6]